MREQHHESPTAQQEVPTTTATVGASCSDGPSKGRSIALASAPGVAEGPPRQGARDQETSAEGSRVQERKRPARRRSRQDKQRRKRQTFRASETEAAEIDATAEAKGISKARFIAQAVHAELHGRPRLDQDDALDRLDAARVQLARAGNNLNQIAKILNSGGDAIHLQRTLDDVRRAATAVKATAQRLVS
ncbi:plasmid mobilization protein [Streptomyces mirabilis]|uniref:plasmid mobilization protein n=1 Tax=Streptomyces mirabilis TaxID=68239 RepID=UPI003673A80E